VQTWSSGQLGILEFDGQIELEALLLFGLPEAALAVLYACTSMPIGTRSQALETTWDLPSLGPGATANMDGAVPIPRHPDRNRALAEEAQHGVAAPAVTTVCRSKMDAKVGIVLGTAIEQILTEEVSTP
jgi:hypothetical protein